MLPTSGEILHDHSMDGDRRSIVDMKSLTRIRTMESALEESHLVGRDNIKSDIIKLMLNQVSPTFQVISVLMTKRVLVGFVSPVGLSRFFGTGSSC
jgi:hypothetical protein